MNTPSSESLIKIGIPTNKRISEDCEPIRRLLELEGNNGALRSRFVPGAIFRPTRVSDMAKNVRNGTFPLGILGDDTAVEYDLEKPYNGEKAKSLDEAMEPWISLGESMAIRPKNKIETFDLPITKMGVFTKPETQEGVVMPYDLLGKGPFATTYPNLARKLTAMLFQRIPETIAVEGGTESMVANEDQGIVGGIDVVRTGKTLESYGLKIWTSLLWSGIGLWQTPQIKSEQKNQIEDTEEAIRERLRPITWDIVGHF